MLHDATELNKYVSIEAAAVQICMRSITSCSFRFSHKHLRCFGSRGGPCQHCSRSARPRRKCGSAIGIYHLNPPLLPLQSLEAAGSRELGRRSGLLPVLACVHRSCTFVVIMERSLCTVFALWRCWKSDQACADDSADGCGGGNGWGEGPGTPKLGDISRVLQGNQWEQHFIDT